MASSMPHEVATQTETVKEPSRPEAKNDQSSTSPLKEKSVYVVNSEKAENGEEVASDDKSVGLELMQKLKDALSLKLENGNVDWEKVMGVLRECPTGANKEAIDVINPYFPPR